MAKGALYYAQHPVAEVTVARENIGLTYLEDQSPTGRPLGGDRVDEGVGWVYKQVGYLRAVVILRALLMFTG